MTAVGKTLIIQIPCFNEGATLGVTLGALPRQVDGFERVDWMVVDDGSTDDTIEVARAGGVDHIVRLGRNQGLARAFAAGLEAAVRLGADVIVNTDADNQYCADDIPKLTAPILAGAADFVVGARPIADTPHFSRAKKALQLLGSMVVRAASRTQVVDAPSGFRAISRQAAQRLHVHGDYTYTLETIIAAGRNNMAVTSVPIRTNPDLRPSRLIRSLPEYVLRSAATIVRSFATYKPLRLFGGLGGALLAAGVGVVVAHLQLGNAQGPAGAAIVGTVLIALGVLSLMLGLVADLVAVNRRLLEKLIELQAGRHAEGHAGAAPQHTGPESRRAGVEPQPEVDAA